MLNRGEVIRPEYLQKLREFHVKIQMLQGETVKVNGVEWVVCGDIDGESLVLFLMSMEKFGSMGLTSQTSHFPLGVVILIKEVRIPLAMMITLAPARIPLLVLEGDIMTKGGALVIKHQGSLF